VIESIGKEKIQADTTSNIYSAQKYIEIIMAECIAKFNEESNGNDGGTTIVTLSKALLHFMLTICALPSEREIRIEEDLTADVIIPNLRTLRRKPDKSIIIQIIEDGTKQDKISRLEVLQPNYQNIWVVYPKTPIATRYRTYCVLSNNAELFSNYSKIVRDINNFLTESGDNSLRLVH